MVRESEELLQQAAACVDEADLVEFSIIAAARCIVGSGPEELRSRPVCGRPGGHPVQKRRPPGVPQACELRAKAAGKDAQHVTPGLACLDGIGNIVSPGGLARLAILSGTDVKGKGFRPITEGRDVFALAKARAPTQCKAVAVLADLDSPRRLFEDLVACQGDLPLCRRPLGELLLLVHCRAEVDIGEEKVK